MPRAATRLAVIEIWLLVLSCVCSAASTDILGTRYSDRLAALLHRVEQRTDKHVVFVPKPGAAENNIRLVGSEYRITLVPGSSEDNVAHELMHALLESEGYVRVFALSHIQLSMLIHPFVVSDFDHLIINQRLHTEGYYPETGFMTDMKEQYKSFVNMKATSSSPAPRPEQRAVFAVGCVHELMKQVYYVRSPKAEEAILNAYPECRRRWLTIKRAIEVFVKNPSPRREWQLVEVYVREMDGFFSDVGVHVRFSDLIGFSPIPVSKSGLDEPASRVLSTSIDPRDRLVRVKAGQVMVGAVFGPAPDLSQPLAKVAALLRVGLLPVRTQQR